MEDTVVSPLSPPVHVLPAPRSFEVSEAGFTLLRTTPLLFQAGTEDSAVTLAQKLRDGLGWPSSAERLPVVGNRAGAPVAGALTLLLDPEQDLGPEGYTLDSTPEGIVLRAATRLGALHAVRTLLQLLPQRVMDPEGALWGSADDEVLAVVPGAHIEDAPRWSHRGVMIDVARSFLPVDDLLRVVEAVSLLKINVLHLHLVDDQGWRLEITNEGRAEDDTHDYTQLTEVSGRTAVALPAWNGRPGRTGWYTQEDYRRILAFCHSRGMEVIPEIDLPGHVGAALHALPGLCTPGSSHTSTPEEPTAPADCGIVVGYSYLDPHAPATRAFLRHVLTQVMDLDPEGRRVHLGGDEPWAMADRYGAGPGSAYAELLTWACEVVRGHGRVPIGWNEAWSAQPAQSLPSAQPAQSAVGTPGDAAASMQLQVWDVRGEESAEGQRLAAERGARFIMSPSRHAYLDMIWDAQAPLGLDWAGVLDLSAARDWDPVGSVEAVGESSIEGVEATVWSETARGVEDVETLLLPRLLGTAEVGWCQALPEDGSERALTLDGFAHRCAAYGARMRAAGTRFVLVPGVPWRQAGPDYPKVAAEQDAARAARS
ncbi:family 20 glycosylhydrolase [Actinomyces respiraculi]|uniref:family 20 glycosylhydrolase n=1 Tax=Actinomyces respiraculi TaxID=2744574 RepID=UPI001422ED01|nr:family 20 glycosylhydrolase [Actinomyces respiraculi]